jgi:phosphatidyl-myo-inositol alpha-mannosyltransferase
MVPGNDAEALANGLVHLLDDEPLRWRLGATGHRRAIEYDWSRVTDQVLAVYDRILDPVPVSLAV